MEGLEVNFSKRAKTDNSLIPLDNLEENNNEVKSTVLKSTINRTRHLWWDDTVKDSNGFVKFNFDFGIIKNHPLYDGFHIKGEHFFGLPIGPGGYSYPDKEKLLKLVDKCRKWWIELGPEANEPEYIEMVLWVGCSYVAYLSPEIDLADDKVLPFAYWAIAYTLLDDVADISPRLKVNSEYLIKEDEIIPKLRSFIKVLEPALCGKYLSYTDIPKVDLGGSCGFKVLKATLDMMSLFRSKVPDWKYYNDWFIDTQLATLNGNIANYITGMVKNSRFDELTINNLRGDEFHVTGTIIMVSAIHGIGPIHRGLRSNFLFRRLIDASGNCKILWNQIYGLKSDVFSNESVEPTVAACRIRGISLAQSMKETLDSYRHEKLILHEICKVFREIYPGDEQIDKLMWIIERFEEGHIHWVADSLWKRYEI